MTPPNKPTSDNLMRYADSRALKLAGSLVVLSVALRIVGLDFAPMMQSYTYQMSQRAEIAESNRYSDTIINELEARIEHLETDVILLKIDSHPASSAGMVEKK